MRLTVRGDNAPLRIASGRLWMLLQWKLIVNRPRNWQIPRMEGSWQLLKRRVAILVTERFWKTKHIYFLSFCVTYLSCLHYKLRRNKWAIYVVLNTNSCLIIVSTSKYSPEDERAHFSFAKQLGLRFNNIFNWIQTLCLSNNKMNPEEFNLPNNCARNVNTRAPQ